MRYCWQGVIRQKMLFYVIFIFGAVILKAYSFTGTDLCQRATASLEELFEIQRSNLLLKEKRFIFEKV